MSSYEYSLCAKYNCCTHYSPFFKVKKYIYRKKMNSIPEDYLSSLIICKYHMIDMLYLNEKFLLS